MMNVEDVCEWNEDCVFEWVKMGHFALLLNLFDDMLRRSVEIGPHGIMRIDCNGETEQNVLYILECPSILFKNTATRSIYTSYETRAYYDHVIDVKAFCSADYTIKHETQSITLNEDYPSFNIDLNKSIQDTMRERHNYFSQLSPLPSQWHFLEFVVQFAYSQCCLEERLNLLSTSLAANRAIRKSIGFG
uniref:Uncharacterized protein n=1 Tax=Globodera rostochiensis TaxID=31243 RepID=A0A914IEZ3_GLORO